MKLAKRGKEKSRPLAPVSKEFGPFWPVQRLQHEIDHLFEDFGSWLAPNGPRTEEWWPAVEVYEDKNNVCIHAELPGMKKEELEVSVSGDYLSITGERKAETKDESAQVYRAERYYGRFQRTVALPAAVDAGRISAHYKDGVLTVTCPKTEEAKQKRLGIKVE